MKKLIIMPILALLIGCGGGGSNQNKKDNIPTGIYEDAPISGVEYKCGSYEGITSNGEFKFEINKSCEFSLFDKKLDEFDASMLKNNSVHLIAQNQDTIALLAALDKDKNFSNGFNIDRKEAKKYFNDLKNLNYEQIKVQLKDYLKKHYSDLKSFESKLKKHQEESAKKYLAGKSFYSYVKTCSGCQYDKNSTSKDEVLTYITTFNKTLTKATVTWQDGEKVYYKLTQNGFKVDFNGVFTIQIIAVYPNGLKIAQEYLDGGGRVKFYYNSKEEMEKVLKSDK